MEETAGALQQTVRSLHAAVTEAGDSVKQLSAANTAEAILESWHEDMLHNLVAEVALSLARMAKLPSSLGEHDLPMLAYFARSQLELNIWIHYCCKSRDNARRFQQDAYRDGLGLQKAFKRLADLAPDPSRLGELRAALNHFGATLQQGAASAGMSSLDDDYNRVAQAADELGWKEAFAGCNTFLSKFAHPTAMVVLMYSPESFGKLFGLFLAMDAVLILDSCQTIKNYVRSLGVAP
jgi:hypothetical protein